MLTCNLFLPPPPKKKKKERKNWGSSTFCRVANQTDRLVLLPSQFQLISFQLRGDDHSWGAPSVWHWHWGEGNWTPKWRGACCGGGQSPDFSWLLRWVIYVCVFVCHLSRMCVFVCVCVCMCACHCVVMHAWRLGPIRKRVICTVVWLWASERREYEIYKTMHCNWYCYQMKFVLSGLSYLHICSKLLKRS